MKLSSATAKSAGTACGRTASTGASEAAATATIAAHLVVVDILRTLLAEGADVIGELNREVTADHAIPSILRETRACRAREGFVLAQDVVHTYEQLAELALEELLTDVGIHEGEVLIVVVGVTDVLNVACRCGEGIFTELVALPYGQCIAEGLIAWG